VVSPLSTLDRVHGDALVKHFPHRSFTILHGAAAKRQRAFSFDFDFYIINHDGIPAITETVKKDGKLQTRLLRDDIDLIILDEFAAYRNGQTQRWKTMKRMIEPRQWVWGMSGKPTPTEPTDAYAEVKLINPAKVSNYGSFRGFQSATMDQLSLYRWKAKPDAMQTVYNILQPSVRYTRDECLDLPDCLYETRDCALTPTQTKVYKDLAKDMIANVRGGKVTALNEGVLLMRLVQVASGVVYDVTGEHIEVDCASRLAALEEIIEEAGTKVIVFVPFIGNIEFLERALGVNHTVATVYGGTPKGERSEIFRRFQDTPDPRILVAHPACMAHGLSLTEASTIVWWAPTTSNEIYEQANGRIERIGQSHSMLIVHLSGTRVENKIYDRLRQQQKLQGILLDLISEATA
jgi:SNF2 family DNA or RNA helicase